MPDSKSHLVIGEGGDLLRRHGDVGAETLAASLEHRVVIRGEAHLDNAMEDGGQNMWYISNARQKVLPEWQPGTGFPSAGQTGGAALT